MDKPSVSLGEHAQVPPDDTVIGRAFWWSLGVMVMVGAIFLAVTLYRHYRVANPAPVPAPRVDPLPRQTRPPLTFPPVTYQDVTSAAGIQFVHTNGAVGEKLLPETMGSGCAFFDFDNDGDQDLLLVNSQHWPDAVERAPTTMALYRNDGRGHFADVTAAAGLDVSLYGMGVACGDYDNDGRVDVYLTALGVNRLFRNLGDRFVDATESAGVAGPQDAWSTSAGFFDFDNDGDLDLFVCNYVQWSRALDLNINYTLNGTDRAYGPPTQYPGSQCLLYRNEGGGKFVDVSRRSGIVTLHPTTGEPEGKALAATFVDVDDDGWLDILVANDTVRNFLFRNLGNGKFEELGTQSGVAFDHMGAATGAMGIDAAHYAATNQLAVAIANFAGESSSLYVQQPGRPWQWADMADAEGVGSPTRLKLSFGLLFFDYDLDGRLDLLQANGHLESEINAIQPSQHYRQAAQLLRNFEDPAHVRFAAVPATMLGDLAEPIVGRGAACADIDGDGDLDVLLTQSGGRPLLLRCDTPLPHHWVCFKLIGGGASNRDAIGAQLEITAAGTTQRRQVMPTRSYLSQTPLTVTFGLGEVDRVEQVWITWPDGTRQGLEDVVADQVLVVEQPPPK